METKDQGKVVVVEGFVNPNHRTKYDEEISMELDHADFVRHKDHVPASLVIGDKAMPMSKVREMLEEILENGTYHGFTTRTAGDISAIATKYGVDL